MNATCERRVASRYRLPLAEYRARIAAGLKRCPVCQKWKFSVHFRRDRSRYDGLQSRCKFCHSKARAD